MSTTVNTSDAAACSQPPVLLGSSEKSDKVMDKVDSKIELEMDHTGTQLTEGPFEKPRKTHILITEGHQRTHRLVIFGMLGLLFLLAANFGLSVLAVLLQKDVYVGEKGSNALVDSRGSPVAVDSTSYAAGLFEVPLQGAAFLSAMKTLQVSTDQGSMYIFFISHVQFKMLPSNSSASYQFALQSEAGHTLTWIRPLEQGKNGNLVFSNTSADVVTIAHPTMPSVQTVSRVEGGRRLTSSPAGFQMMSSFGGAVSSYNPSTPAVMLSTFDPQYNRYARAGMDVLLGAEKRAGVAPNPMEAMLGSQPQNQPASNPMEAMFGSQPENQPSSNAMETPVESQPDHQPTPNAMEAPVGSQPDHQPTPNAMEAPVGSQLDHQPTLNAMEAPVGSQPDHQPMPNAMDALFGSQPENQPSSNTMEALVGSQPDNQPSSNPMEQMIAAR